MHEVGFELPLQDWFDFKIPRTKINANYIENCLDTTPPFNTKPSNKIIWLGTEPLVESYTKSKRGDSWEMLKLNFHLSNSSISINLDQANGNWLINILPTLSISNKKLLSFSELKAEYEKDLADFELFWYSKPMNILRENGLLAI